MPFRPLNSEGAFGQGLASSSSGLRRASAIPAPSVDDPPPTPSRTKCGPATSCGGVLSGISLLLYSSIRNICSRAPTAHAATAERLEIPPMSVKLRLKRMGRTNAAFYRLNAIDSRSPARRARHRRARALRPAEQGPGQAVRRQARPLPVLARRRRGPERDGLVAAEEERRRAQAAAPAQARQAQGGPRGRRREGEKKAEAAPQQPKLAPAADVSRLIASGD